MRKLFLTAGVATVALIGTVATAANTYLGKEAPEILLQEWIGGDGRNTLADFRGEVVLLEFWKTH